MKQVTPHSSTLRAQLDNLFLEGSSCLTTDANASDPNQKGINY